MNQNEIEHERTGGDPFPDLENIFDGQLAPFQYWHRRLEDQIDEWEMGIASGYSTGFAALDKVVRLYPGELTVIGARPGMGKTQIALQMGEFVATQLGANETDDGVVAIYSAEMPATTLYARMATMHTGVSFSDIRSGKATHEQIQTFRGAAMDCRTLPIWVSDASGITTDWMLNELKSLHATNPIRMMVFDFLELANPGFSTGGMEERVSRIVHALKAIAVRLKIPVVAISQLNRDVDQRANKMPQLSDLRGSGMIEQLADVILFLMTPQYYFDRGQTVTNLISPTLDRQGVTYGIVAKNRNGGVGLTKLAWIANRAKFGNLAITGDLT